MPAITGELILGVSGDRSGMGCSGVGDNERTITQDVCERVEPMIHRSRPADPS
jgi:hypothetical protein